MAGVPGAGDGCRWRGGLRCHLQRARHRGELDRIELEQIGFFERTRQRYLELAAADDSIQIIDAGLPPAQVKAAIEAALEHYLASEGLCIPG